MCTVTLSYDKKNARARDMLATIIESGLFYVNSFDLGIVDQPSQEVFDSGDRGQRDTLQKARAMTREQLLEMQQQEYLSPEDLRLLLYRTVDDIYCQA